MDDIYLERGIMSKEILKKNDIKKDAITGFFWKTIEQYGFFLAQFFLQIFLARILEPNDYGIVAIANVFIALSNVLIQTGFATAIVQRKTIDNYDISSIFWASELIALLLYVVLYFFAPCVGAFYDIPILTLLIRVMSLTFFMNGYISIQNALIRRNLMFKDSFFINSLAVAISGLCGIVSAVYGLGVWSLVIQQITFSFLTIVLSVRIVHWKPMLYFKFLRVKGMLNFGAIVIAKSLLDELFVSCRSLLVGKIYTSADLSFYNRGQSFPGLILKGINGSISAVLLPTMSKIQENKNDVKKLLRRSISCSAFFMFPILTIIFVSSPNIVTVLLTDKWLPAVIFIRIFCIYYATWPIITLNQQTLYALGKPDIVFRLSVVGQILNFIVLLITLNIGVVSIAIGAAVVSGVVMVICMINCGRLTDYSIIEQINDICPIIMGCLIILPILYFVDLLIGDSMLALLIQLFLGCASFYLYARLLRLESFDYILKQLKGFKITS